MGDSPSNAPMQGIVPPPPGVTPDFSGSRTQLQQQVLVTYSVVTAISTIFLCLRLYTRGFLSRSLGLDDLLLVLSWLGCVAWFAVCVWAFRFGFGEHAWNVTPVKMMNYLETLIGICVIYVWTPALTKFSLLVLYHRIGVVNSLMRLAIYGLAVLIFGYTLSITIVVAGPCNPTTHSDPKCLKDLNLFMAIINITTDVLIILVPIPMLHALQLRKKQKILLGIVFALGSGVAIVSIVRIIYVYNYVGNPDVTFYQASACIFSELELNAGVVCASMAILKPFVVRYMSFLSFSSRSAESSESRSRSFGWLRKTGGESKSYALGSVDNREQLSSKDDAGFNIKVSTSYDVSSAKRKLEDSESTKRIIVP